MGERRLEGGRLLKAGKLSQAEVARQMGVSRATVSTWAKTVEAKGLRGLRKRKAAGSSAKLNARQKQKLKSLLDRGFARLRRRPDLLLSFFHAAGLSVRQLRLT